MNEVLLRGCMLKNSGSVFGMVVYTGDETRIQKNAAKTPFKVTTPQTHTHARTHAHTHTCA
jgi:magnesium-transporting ATPase (P-type)